MRQFRQFGDVRGDAPRLVAGEELGGGAASRLLLELEIGERLAVPSLSSEALQIQLGVGVLDDQGGGKRREGWRRAQRGYSQ